ncbi:MAG: ABC transporter substrate-binding protein, partial [Chloroflexi bacterium]|nr:ABC transporter substrate-binding protein [Chloroflexota bacterium]
AKSWDISTDGKTYTFHINEKAKFSDGTAVTADDVKYSIDISLAAATSAADAMSSFVSSVEKIDNLTVAIKLKEPYGVLLSGVTGVFIVPKALWHTYVPNDDPATVTSYANNQPIGSGLSNTIKTRIIGKVMSM